MSARAKQVIKRWREAGGEPWSWTATLEAEIDRAIDAAVVNDRLHGACKACGRWADCGCCCPCARATLGHCPTTEAQERIRAPLPYPDIHIAVGPEAIDEVLATPDDVEMLLREACEHGQLIWAFPAEHKTEWYVDRRGRAGAAGVTFTAALRALLDAEKTR